MHGEFDPASIPVRLSATVLVARPTSTPHPVSGSAIEVLLLRRNDRSGFVAGVTLYPGGAVDHDDHRIPTAAQLADAVSAGPNADGSFHHLATEHLHPIAAAAGARECFEEAGVLLAAHADGSWAHPERTVVDPSRPFAEALVDASLHVPVHRFRPWGRWVTPLGAPRRYDTLFFLVDAPPDCVVTVDGREIVHAAWWDPGDALLAEYAGDLRFVTPTRKTLERLARHRTLDEALADAGPEGR